MILIHTCCRLLVGITQILSYHTISLTFIPLPCTVQSTLANQGACLHHPYKNLVTHARSPTLQEAEHCCLAESRGNTVPKERTFVIITKYVHIYKVALPLPDIQRQLTNYVVISCLTRDWWECLITVGIMWRYFCRISIVSRLRSTAFIWAVVTFQSYASLLPSIVSTR